MKETEGQYWQHRSWDTAVKIDFDVDIDIADRKKALKLFKHTPASILRNGNYTRHNTGVYFQDIPKLYLENISAIDHKQAQDEGWFKVDFLNNGIYEKVRDPDHMDKLANTEPMWELLEHEEVVSQLNHVSNYPDLLKQYKPSSIPQLAMILAIIRPAKKHLIGKNWEEIEKEIWKTPPDGTYYYKKSHAHAFALSIVVQLNLLVEPVQSDFFTN